MKQVETIGSGVARKNIRGNRPLTIVLKAMGKLWQSVCFILLRFQVVSIGHGTRVAGFVVISGGKKISLGKNVYIGRNVQLIADNDATISIGDNVEIRDNVRLYAHNIHIGSDITLGENTFLVGNITIKDGCWVSRGCDLTGDIEVGKAILGPWVACLSSDHARSDSGAVLMNEPGISGRVVIHDGSWIGMNTTVLKGVTIGENAIVGAGSVVTKSVPDGGVYAGVPAKEIVSKLNTNKAR